jgi:ABC-type transport system substrate-binding protein
MKKFMAAIVIASIALAGCSTTSGPSSSQSESSSTTYTPAKVYAVNPATIASFKAGATTLDQVEATLGKPVGAVRTPSGNQVIAYVKVRSEDVDNDRTPETGTALPKRHKIRYATMLSFDAQGRWISSWTRVDDLGDASPTALGHFDAGDILTNQDGMP